jgi:hypothetical protein
MRRKLLTLAISQINDNYEYVLIAYDELKCRLVSIEVHRDEIECNGRIYFDIGSVSEVEELREMDFSKYPVGMKKVINRYTREQLKLFFEREKVNIEAFRLNRNFEKYSIIKISSVENFYVKDNNLRMKFWTGGVRNDFLIKDDRWLSYTKYNGNKENFSYKLNDFVLNFNNSQRVGFAILFKYKEYDAVWIAGLHLL